LLPIQIHTVPAMLWHVCQRYSKAIPPNTYYSQGSWNPFKHLLFFPGIRVDFTTWILCYQLISCSHTLVTWFQDLILNWCCCGFEAAHNVLTTPVAQVRDQLIVQCVTILYTYRKFCATASSSGQLILPEALKLLPLYTMGMLAIPPLHGIHDHWHRFWKCSLCKSHKVVTGLLLSYLQIVVVEISLQIS